MSEMTDPTYQTTGGLLVTFRNMMWGTTSVEDYENLVAPRATVNPPTYGPGNEQPPRTWVRGAHPCRDGDWWGQDGMVPTPDTVLKWIWTPPTYQFGTAFLAGVNDMSANSVATGHIYCFTVDVYHAIRLYWVINGIVGGSTITPGFGFYNLTSKPNDWSYVTPLSFDGTFLVELLDPDFYEIMKLSVDWSPHRLYPLNVSKLNFSIETARASDPITDTAAATGPVEDSSQPQSIRELELLTAEGASVE